MCFLFGNYRLHNDHFELSFPSLLCPPIEMGREAAEAALKDAGIEYTQVQAVVASYCYGDPTCGEL